MRACSMQAILFRTALLANGGELPVIQHIRISLALAILSVVHYFSAPAAPAQVAPGNPAAAWTPISNALTRRITSLGNKTGYPGGTAGVVVNRITGDLYMVVPDQGMWRSSDHGTTFERVDGGKAGGRCETGFALNADPAGGRMACFMLDGTANLVTNAAQNWKPLQNHGRGWDYGVVDWSARDPKTILAVHHESGCELHLSADAGASWKLLGKDFTSIGLFDETTFVASKGNGVLRSTDGGATWNTVSELTPTGRTLTVLDGKGYWVCKDGLMVSADRGKTWHVQGAPIEAAWGPFFGKTAQQIVVVGRQPGSDPKRSSDGMPGFYRTDDGGKQWKLIAPFPGFEKENIPDWTPGKQWAAGWFCCFAWDPIANICYASRMGHAALKYVVQQQQ